MKLSKGEITSLIITLASFGLAAIVYPQMPNQMASHWNAVGQIDGYMSKFGGLFLMPIISVAMWLMFIIIPKIDPKAASIEKFRGYFDEFIITLFLFMFYIYLITLGINLGYEINMPRAMALGFVVLLLVMSRLIKVAEPNWSIGIRTPWTMSSDSVWKQTHLIGAKVLKISALFALLGFFIPQYAFLLVILPLCLGMLGTIIYSYILFRREKKV